jgi:hypothetical protein
MHTCTLPPHGPPRPPPDRSGTSMAPTFCTKKCSDITDQGESARESARAREREGGGGWGSVGEREKELRLGIRFLIRIRNQVPTTGGSRASPRGSNQREQ